MSSSRTFALMVFAGLTIVQLAWIASVPPFRGIDEFDHVYRAEGVASGQYLLTEDAADGRGRVVEVPGDLVAAAEAQCASLEYTQPDNCYPIAALPGGRVEIATAAADYHPAYYALIGFAGSPFEGARADYAMRVASALLFSLVLAAAALCWTWGSAGRWHRLGFLLCLTPILVYSSAMPAPNALEIGAGMLVWCCLLRLVGGGEPRRSVLIGAGTLGACLLVTLRYLGPLWLLLAVATIAVFGGYGPTADLLRQRWRSLGVAAIAVGLATVASVAWTRTTTFLGAQESAVPDDAVVDLGAQPLVWLFQTVAAFPLRGDASHPFVYVVYLVMIIGVLGGAVVLGRGRERAALLLAVVVVAGLPVVLTLATVDTHGVIWQGRYGLAYGVGLPLMASLMLDSRGVVPREAPRLVALGCLLLALAHSVALAVFVAEEGQRRESTADAAWLDPPVWLVVTVVLLGWAILGRTAARSPTERARQPVG